jgi:hypothetical protein
MLTLQHSLVTFLALDGDIDRFRFIVAYDLLPDAIRKYTEARQTSHFEINSTGTDVSFMKFPLDLKNLTKETSEKIEGHLAGDIKPCCIGETTQLHVFDQWNKHLPIQYYCGIRMHLIQDYFYDEFIRNIIDCSDKYNDKFIYNGKSIDGTTVRKYVADIEEDGFCILAKEIYDKCGVVTDQAWFDRNVRDIIKTVYSDDLATGTYNYMKIKPEINRAIQTQDWRKCRLHKIANISGYCAMYSVVHKNCSDIAQYLDRHTCKIIKVDGDLVFVQYKDGKQSMYKKDTFKLMMKQNRVLVSNAKLSSDNRLLVN